MPTEQRRPKERRWRRGDKLGFHSCPLCHDEVTAQIIEAMYPGLIVCRSWCTKHQLWAYGCNIPPEQMTQPVTVAFTEPL